MNTDLAYNFYTAIRSNHITQSILDTINHIPLIDNSYDISDLAEDCGTIPYEILTSFGNRIKKVYVD